MMKLSPADQVVLVRGMPILKDALSFFQYKQESRLFLTITDSIQAWQNDLILAERFFADMFVCPFQIDPSSQDAAHLTTADILKQRMKYPGVNDQPDLLQIAKTWVLPSKLHKGPDASLFLEPNEKAINNALEPVFTQIKMTESQVVHILKIEVGNGVERQFVYKILDSGFRPSIMLVKWSHDMDDHTATANCAGHLMNSGYSLFANENGYALYVFTEQTLYDICSMKTVGVSNPFISAITQEFHISQQKSPQTTNSVEVINNESNTP